MVHRCLEVGPLISMHAPRIQSWWMRVNTCYLKIVFDCIIMNYKSMKSLRHSDKGTVLVVKEITF